MRISWLDMRVAAAGVAFCAGPALAFVPWSNTNGAGSFFTWSGGGSNLGLFGNPTLGGGGNILVFNPTGFVATSVGGSAQTTTDHLQVRLTANAGSEFTQIRISELGSYVLTGIGPGSVSASGAMFITDLIESRPTELGPMVMTPGFPIVAPATGVYSGEVIINLAAIGDPWTDITLSFTNTLQATSSGQVSSTVTKSHVEIEILPTPGTASLLGFGALAAGRRRRR